MPTFSYSGRRQGVFVQGYLTGRDEDAILEQLRSSTIIPISIQLQSDTSTSVSFSFFRPKKVKIEQILMFCRQMYTLLRAGVPLVRALRGLSEMSADSVMTEILSNIASTVESGKPLTTAFGQHPRFFSGLFVSMVHVGENTGKLDEAFNQLSSYLDLEFETKKRIKVSTRYPMVVLGVVSVALVIVNVFIIPVFAKIFKDFKAELPWPTQILIAMSHFFVTYWWLILIVVVLAAWGTRIYLRTPAGEYRWDYLKLRIPWVGKILQYSLLARFARSFAVMFRAGVPIVQVLHVVTQAVGNAYIARHIQTIQERTEAGDPLSRSVAATKLFTPLILQMIAVGEETGSIDTMLLQVAEFYEREVDYSLRRLSDAIEPTLILMIAGMVLVLALGIFLPLWSLSTTLH